MSVGKIFFSTKCTQATGLSPWIGCRHVCPELLCFSFLWYFLYCPAVM